MIEDPQNPGIGGLNELTDDEEILVGDLNSISRDKGTIISGNGSTFVGTTPASNGQTPISDDTQTGGIRWDTVSSTDEKVKYNTDDASAGYLADKVVAGTGISLSEGTGGDADKLVITNTLDTLAEIANTPTDPFVATTGQGVIDEIGAILTVQHEPTGMSDVAESTISFDNGTRTFTIAPVGANFNYYIAGKKYTKTVAQTVVIPDTEGIHFIYFDGDTLTASMVGDEAILTQYAYVANVYWDATNNIALVFGDERHGLVMDNKTHAYLHKTRGTGLESGGALGDILVDQTGDNNTHAQFSNAATVIWDEDLKHSLIARNSTDNIAVYYRSGADASNIWRLNESTPYGVLTTGTGRAAYNQNNAGTWQLTEVADTDFVLAHVFAFNDTTRRFGVVMGQDTYTTLANARDGATTELNSITLTGLPSQEFKFLGTIIYQTDNNYTNAVKSRIRAIDTSGNEYVDLRTMIFPAAGSSATVVSHTDLSNLSWDDSGHIGTAANLAGFDGTGAADNYPIGIADNSIVQIDHASVADNDYAKFTANGLEGRSYSEVKQDLAIEGTEILSTGETGGTKFLREDGDGSCSWQTVSAGGDVSKVGTPADNQIGVWTGNGTIEGTAGLTYDGANLQLTGDIGSTGTKITKGWFTDIESTNMPTVGGTSLSSTFAAIAGNTAQAFSALSLDIGNADTTLTRVSAGVAAIEGKNIYLAGGTDVAITDGGTGASTAADAFTALKQAATDSATGVVEIATAAEIDTGTDTARSFCPDAFAGSNRGKRLVQIKVFDDATALATGDGKAIFMIPVELNGMNLVDVEGFITTVSSSGAPSVQVRNITQAADMLSTAITIDANEYTSLTAATAPVIDTNNDDVATGDLIAIDVDAAGTGAKGLGIQLSFQTP